MIDHSKPFLAQLHAQEIKDIDYIFCLNNTDQHWNAMAEVIKPQGHICSIVELSGNVDLNLLKNKSVSFSWEFMFTRSLYNTEDMIEQYYLLNRISALIDAGKIITTLTEVLSPIGAANLRTAHEKIEAGKTIGKIVLENWN